MMERYRSRPPGRMDTSNSRRRKKASAAHSDDEESPFGMSNLLDQYRPGIKKEFPSDISSSEESDTPPPLTPKKTKKRSRKSESEELDIPVKKSEKRSRPSISKESPPKKRKIKQETSVIDLTDDDPPNQHIPGHVQFRELTDEQKQMMAFADVPDSILGLARQHYASEGLSMPVTVRIWQDFKRFVKEHHKRGYTMTPASCDVAEAQAYWGAIIQQNTQQGQLSGGTGHPGNQTGWYNEIPQRQAGGYHPHMSGAVKVKTEPVQNIMPPFQRQPQIGFSSQAMHTQPVPTQIPTHPPFQMPFDSTHLKYQPKIKVEPQEDKSRTQPPQNTPAIPPQQQIVTSVRPRLGPIPQAVPYSTPVVAPVETLTTKSESQALNGTITAPPEGQAPELECVPRILTLWDPQFLDVPVDRHEHLSLPDVVISIFAKYDLKYKSVLKGFLNTKEFPHFFFLFKARAAHLHSWSIEREHDTITIGIERQRALNHESADTSAPSAGQYDLTVQYLISAATQPQPTSTTDPTNPSQPAIIKHEPLDNKVIPKWTLINTSTIASSPPLQKFLWTTPPSRGADETEKFAHPAQSAMIADKLSMFARYMQQTAFRANAMDAEFQIAFGKRVRYDWAIGRIRLVSHHAVQSARTAREKREKNEHTRAKKAKILAGETGVKKDECKAKNGDCGDQFSGEKKSEKGMGKMKDCPDQKIVKLPVKKLGAQGISFEDFPGDEKGDGVDETGSTNAGESVFKIPKVEPLEEEIIDDFEKKVTKTVKFEDEEYDDSADD